MQPNKRYHKIIGIRRNFNNENKKKIHAQNGQFRRDTRAVSM